VARDAPRALARVGPPQLPPRRLLDVRAASLPAIVATVLFVLAYANGGYGLTSRTILAICLWWVIILGFGLGLLQRARPPRAALTAGVLLAGFVAWTLASAIWAPSAENAVEAFNRGSLYLAVFTLTVAGASRGNIRRLVDGASLAIVVTAFVALTSRLFPHIFSTRQIGVFLPYAAPRLSFPVGYWNGLAILVGFGVPLCLRWALVGRSALTRALALAPVPVLASVIYLASSRGGVVAAGIGVVVFLATTDRRWAACGATLAAVGGSLVAVAVLVQSPTLVNGPLGTGTAVSQGRIAALLIAGCCFLAPALLVAGERALSGRFHPTRRLGWSTVGALAVLVVAGTVLAHPVRRFDAFKQPLAAGQVDPSNFAAAHLLSGNGSGRWQFWAAAVHEFTSAPIIGRGAGSYEFWWAQHASFTYFLKNAHSLYLELLGELGIVGFLLLSGAFAAGLVAAVSRLRRSGSEERVTLAAIAGVFVAFLVAAGIDWIWQLTVIGVIGVAALALLTGPATAGATWRQESTRLDATKSRSRIAVGIGFLAGAWVLICLQAIPWFAATRISDSQAAVRHGDLSSAVSAALDAKSLEPWAASPYVQLALVEEARHQLPDADRLISQAISRDSTDWSVWYVASRIEREDGRPIAAARSYARASALDPRSPVFTAQGQPTS
jgi:hypothetical protein